MGNNITDSNYIGVLREIKTALDLLEGANTHDIYAESDN